jgi:hypothetical protein
MVLAADRLIEKLRRTEALQEGAKTEGESRAAALARERIEAALRRCRPPDPPVEHRFSIRDPWLRRLFRALLARHGLEPYRYARQRRQTVMVRARRSLVDEVLWPRFCELSELLTKELDSLTRDLIAFFVGDDHARAGTRRSGATWR